MCAWVIAVCHNGNLVNASELRNELRAGSIFQSSSDTEVILHLYAHRRRESRGRDRRVGVAGAGRFHSLMTRDRMIAVRDPHRFRLAPAVSTTPPSRVGECDGPDWGHNVRDIEPGEVLSSALRACAQSSRFRRRRSHCVFEHVCFARPDGYVSAAA